MTIQELDSIIAELRQQLATAKAEQASAQTSVDGWVQAVSVDSANGATYETVQNTTTQLNAARARLANATNAVNVAEGELAAKLRLREALEKAAADAIARGVSPEQAYALAAAEVLAQERKTKLLNAALLVGGILLLLVVLAWLWKKYRS